MKRDVVLHLDEFGRHALDSFVRERRASRSGAVRVACLYYLADQERKRVTWRVPPFAAENGENPHPDGGMTVTLDDQTFDALSAEATRQDVRLAALVEHALIYFLADVDSGRVGDRLDDALEKYTAGL